MHTTPTASQLESKQASNVVEGSASGGKNCLESDQPQDDGQTCKQKTSKPKTSTPALESYEKVKTFCGVL